MGNARYKLKHSNHQIKPTFLGFHDLKVILFHPTNAAFTILLLEWFKVLWNSVGVIGQNSFSGLAALWRCCAYWKVFSSRWSCLVILELCDYLEDMWVVTVIVMKLVIHHTRLVIKYLSAVLEPWLGLNYHFAIWLEGNAPSFPAAFIISHFRCLCTASVDPHRGGFWSYWEIFCLTGECLSCVFSWCCPLCLHLPTKLHYSM